MFMARRSKSRQLVVQALYQVDLNPDTDPQSVRDLISGRLSDETLKAFAWSLFAGVMEHRAELDAAIQNVAQKWRLSRMAATDRAVLRLGAYELLKTATPPGVVIDEAIELAKKFGDAQSAQFVNGILDRLIPEERRKPRANESTEEQAPDE